MPSSSDPKSNVNAGPGKLSVGTVPASSLLFPVGGGGTVLALSVEYSGDGAWVDGTTNPATSVDAQLTKIITDLTATTVSHAGSDKLAARTTVATFADSSTATGASLQALIENVITKLAATAGAARVGSTAAAVPLIPSTTVSGATIQALIENLVDHLATGEVRGQSAAITVSGPTVNVTGLTNMTPDMIGRNLIIQGSTTVGNNGGFPIATWVDATHVTITNGSAVTDAGPLVWVVDARTISGANRIGATGGGALLGTGAPPAPVDGSLQSLIDVITAWIGLYNITSGTTASISAPSVGDPVGLTNMLPQFVGQRLNVTSAVHGTNIGTYTILSYVSATSVTAFGLPGGLAEAGTLVWDVPGGSSMIGAQQIPIHPGGTSPNRTLNQGTVFTQLTALLGLINDDFNVTTQTTAYVIDGDAKHDAVIITNSAPFSLDLIDPASFNGRRLYIADKSGALSLANPLTLLRFGGEKIDGVAANLALTTPLGRWILSSDGTDWYVWSC